MANTHETLGGLFTDIANAIRGKTGSSALVLADRFPEAIEAIESGGGEIEGVTMVTKSSALAPGTVMYAASVINKNLGKRIYFALQIANGSVTSGAIFPKEGTIITNGNEFLVFAANGDLVVSEDVETSVYCGYIAVTLG